VQPLLYGELVPWYRLIDPPEDHAEEAESYREAFERAVSGSLDTLLDLGSGGGHNAFHLKHRFRCTLTDLSDAMLGASRELNPECEHVQGDMRTLVLGRTFDAVLVHDAITYMTNEADLLAAAQTAFVHTRPGGAALFTPDCLKDTFVEDTDLLEAEDGGRAVRTLEWKWDPDPHDDVISVDYAFMLRKDGEVTVVHDRHVEGLFAKSTWERILTSVGYRIELIPRPIGDGEFDEVFLCRRPDRGRSERPRAPSGSAQ
jgi:SAM-dependent methyltransferase